MSFKTMMVPESTLNILALWLIPGLGPQRLKLIFERFDPVSSVFNQKPAVLRAELGINDTIARSITDALRADALKKELEYLDKYGLNLVDCTQVNYPRLLKQIYNAPPILYVKGKTDFNRGLPIAFVGSRKASYYGKSMCRKLVKQLARFSGDVKIISGLAIGIDHEAHVAALENGLETVAVLAGGLSEIYPARHKKLAETISQNGALISEFPITSQPVATNFPLRNRIVSGMSKGSVIVEAGIKSGASITAGYAIEQNRELFALPGPADSDFHKGTNRLIQSGQAKLIMSADDIIEEISPQLSWEGYSPDREDSEAVPGDMTAQESEIMRVLKVGEARQDKLVDDLEFPTHEVLSALTSLELKGLVISKPGSIYQLASP